MKKLTLTLISLGFTATACGPVAQPLAQAPIGNLSAPMLGAQSAQTSAKAPSDALKGGTNELAPRASKGMPKQAAAAPSAPAGNVQPLARRRGGNLSQSEIATMAKIGLQGMDRARTWESGYNIGYETLRSLSRENSYVARLTAAAVAPQMKFESAYKGVAHGLNFIADSKEINVYNSVTLIRQIMNSAKTWEDGARIGYATIDFISQTAQPGIRSALQSMRRSAAAARTWEDAYHVMYDGYAHVRSMN